MLEYICDAADPSADARRNCGRRGLSPEHLPAVFRRWAGLTPKDFLQALTP